MIKKERDKWLKRFESNDLFDSKDIADALDEELDAKRNDLPRIAPHLSFRLKNEFQNNGFKVEGFYSNVAGRAFDPDSSEFALVARQP